MQNAQNTITPASQAPNGQSLSTAQWEAVFHLLGTMAVADGRIVAEEIESIWTLLTDLSKRANLDLCVTRVDVLGWVSDNAAHYDTHMKSEHARTWLAHHLFALTTTPLRVDVYRALESVAVSDQALDAAEYDVMMLAASIWNLTPCTNIMAKRYT